MFKALFNIIINLLATVVQIVMFPLNAIISSALPDVSDKLTEVGSAIGNMFNSISWALGLIPGYVIEVLLFIFTIEIAKHTIRISTHSLIKVWNLFQKLKFW